MTTKMSEQRWKERRKKGPLPLPPPPIRFPQTGQGDADEIERSHDRGKEVEWDHDKPQKDCLQPEHSPDYQRMQNEIIALSTEVVELRAQNKQQERSLHEFAPT